MSFWLFFLKNYKCKSRQKIIAVVILELIDSLTKYKWRWHGSDRGKDRCEREEKKKDSLESLLEEKLRNQVLSDYRRSLGNEYRRKYLEWCSIFQINSSSNDDFCFFFFCFLFSVVSANFINNLYNYLVGVKTILFSILFNIQLVSFFDPFL